MHPYRTHICGELRPEHVGQTVRLSGWVHRKRDHGQLLFIDLRDHFGITQIVFQPEQPFFRDAEALRLESVLTVTGAVVARSEETVNPQLATGAVEVVADALVLDRRPSPAAPGQRRARLSRGDAAPLSLPRSPPGADAAEYPAPLEGDLEHPPAHGGAGLRRVPDPDPDRELARGCARFFGSLAAAPGEFYALPQAPQQYKQLLMISGFDRYFQIAPCFRDEDARADRSPGEFYQLDLEMAFVGQEDVFAAVEPVMRGVSAELTDWEVTPLPFPRIPYHAALRAFGTDKPDLRNPLLIGDVTDAFRGSEFKVFARLIETDEKARVWAIPAPAAAVARSATG